MEGASFPQSENSPLYWTVPGPMPLGNPRIVTGIRQCGLLLSFRYRGGTLRFLDCGP